MQAHVTVYMCYAWLHVRTHFMGMTWRSFGNGTSSRAVNIAISCPQPSVLRVMKSWRLCCTFDTKDYCACDIFFAESAPSPRLDVKPVISILRSSQLGVHRCWCWSFLFTGVTEDQQTREVSEMARENWGTLDISNLCLGFLLDCVISSNNNWPWLATYNWTATVVHLWVWSGSCVLGTFSLPPDGVSKDSGLSPIGTDSTSATLWNVAERFS